MDGERESKESVMSARLGDDADDFFLRIIISYLTPYSSMQTNDYY